MSDNLEPVDLLKIINGYSNAGASAEKLAYVFEALSPHITITKEKEYKETEIRIMGIISGKKEKSRNVTDDVIGYINDITGEVSISRIYSDLGLMLKEEKDLCRHAVRVLVKKGVVETTGSKTGIYRKIDKEDNIIDWRTADEKEYPIRFPLNIQDLVKLYPGNIVVVAGASNSGKTSFMLETVRLNQNTYDTYYFNSEMGPSELRTRIRLFSDVIKMDDWKFTAIERSENFADVIKPGKLNIIDFMEVYDDFWKVGGWIRDIHKKLDGGVAVIALQKNASTKKVTHDTGRSGELSLEKPRLYLAMDRGRIKITKGKAWRNHEQNPNGMVRQFNILKGWKMLPKTDWINEEQEKTWTDKSKLSEYGVAGVGNVDKDEDGTFTHEE